MALRFAILRHDQIAEPHFDLLFERSPGSALAAFRSPRWPITQPTPLVILADHRRHYLEYQGPVSGNRGQVKRVADGTYWAQEQDAQTRILHLQQAAGEFCLMLQITPGPDPRCVAQPG